MSVPANPTAAILIIGDEILSGRTLDSNIGTLTRFLGPLGIDVIEVRVVRDIATHIVGAVNALRACYDYVFSTGGIGPTHDDITADAMAEAFGVEISEHPEALALLLGRYGDALTPNARRMARIPASASLIRNPVSTAPGFQIGNVFVMAGVPSIMKSMLDDVVPRLKTGRPVVSRTVVLRGLGESWAADALRAVDEAFDGVTLGSYPFGNSRDGEFGSHLVARGLDGAEVDAAIAELKSRLGPIVEGARARYAEAMFEDLVLES